MEDGPLSLREQCFLHLVCCIEQYSPHELSLLPLYSRRALLRMLPPAHLFHLEQTAVANGIDTDPMWTKISELPVRATTYKSFRYPHPILDSYKDGLGVRYFAYFWHKFLGKFHEQSPWPLSRSSAEDLVQMVFAIHTDMLEDSTAEFLKSHRQGRFVPVSRLHSYNLAPAHCLLESGSETIAYLIKICPGVSVLDLNISQVQSSALWQQKEDGILQQLVQKSQVRKIKLDFLSALQHASIGKFILITIFQNAIPVLESVELINLSVNVLSALVPLFSAPEGYNGLKDLHARLTWIGFNLVAETTLVQYPLFASIVDHQKALESLDLSQLGYFPRDTEGERFIVALISLLGQPKFRRLRLCWCEDFPLVALQSIVEAFMSSSPPSEQHLTLVSIKIVDNERSPLMQTLKSHSKYLSVSAAHAAAFGPRKNLHLQYSHIPYAFLKWFRGMVHIFLNTLEFTHCTPKTAKFIRRKFEKHRYFIVENFICT